MDGEVNGQMDKGIHKVHPMDREFFASEICTSAPDAPIPSQVHAKRLPEYFRLPFSDRMNIPAKCLPWLLFAQESIRKSRGCQSQNTGLVAR